MVVEVIMRKLRYLLLLITFLFIGCDMQPTSNETIQDEQAIVYLHYDHGEIVEIETYVGAVIDLPLDLPFSRFYIFKGWFDGEGYYLGPTEVKETQWVLQSSIELFEDNYAVSTLNWLGSYTGDSDVLVIPYYPSGFGTAHDYSGLFDQNDDIRVLYLPDTSVNIPDLEVLENLETLVFYPVYREGVLTDESQLYIDPQTNEPIEDLYLPYGYTSEMIYPNSLTNEVKSCHVASPYCKNPKAEFVKKDMDTPIGFYVSYVDEEREGVFNYWVKNIWIPDEVLLEITLAEGYLQNQSIIDQEASLKVYFESADVDKTQYLVFDSSDPITYNSFEDLTFKIDLAEQTDLPFDHHQYRIFLVYDSNNEDSFVLESMSLSAKSGDTIYGDVEHQDQTYLFYASGYDMSFFRKDLEHGTSYDGQINMIDGVATHTHFRLNPLYEFYVTVRVTIGDAHLLEYIEDYQCTLRDGSEIILGETYPLVLNEECIVTEIVSRNPGVTVPGIGTIYSYNVLLSNAIYGGYVRITPDLIPNIDEIDYVILPDYLDDEE